MMNDTTRQLVSSLKARHFDDESLFTRIYGEDVFQKFGGMIPVVKAFLEELENGLTLEDLDARTE